MKILLLAAVFIFSPKAHAENPENLKLILLIGQSNMAGRGEVTPADKKFNPRIFMLNEKKEWVLAIDPLHFDKPGAAGSGLGSEFARQLAKQYPDANIGLIPCAFGGTSISQWQPSGELTKNESGHNLLYTGDFKTGHSLTSENPAFPHADILVMESTFGKPEYVFPSNEVIHKELVAFTRSALDDNCIPIVLGYSLGKAQEAHAILAAAGIPVVLHRSVYDMATAFAKLGIYDLPTPVKMEKTVPPGHALIAPPNLIRSRAIRNLKNKRSVMLSGWALNPSTIFRYQTDEVICLSDHADFPGLLEAVEKIKPSLIYTLHGSTREFASELRDRGYEAWSIYGDDQLELLGKEKRDRLLQEIPRPESQFRQLSELLESLQENPSRLKKASLLADFIAPLSEDDLTLITNWLRETRANRIGPSIIKQSILQTAAQPLAHYKTISAQQNDSARTARIMLEEAKLAPEPLTLSQIAEEFSRINATSVQLEKITLLSALLKKNHSREGETLIRIASGGIRAGVKDGLIEDAIAQAYSADPAEVRRAHMLIGDLSETAILAKNKQLERAALKVGTPLKPMLASPATDVEKISQWHHTTRQNLRRLNKRRLGV